MAKFVKKVEHYELRDPIGNPQESRVFVGRDTAEDRSVAIKALPLDFFQSQREFDQFAELTRRIATELVHPNILLPEKVIGKYTEAFLVTELVDGPNMRTYVEESAPPVPRVTEIALQLLNGLQYLHSKKLLHRNLKSSNVLVRPDQTVVMCDMFYSQLFVRWRKEHGFPSVESVRYVCPEECQEKKLVPASDVYSLGVILYFGYTRIMPIRGTSAMELQTKHVKLTLREKPEMINPQVPPFISNMLLKMLAKAPKKRYTELGELIMDLRRLSGIRPGPRQSRRI